MAERGRRSPFSGSSGRVSPETELYSGTSRQYDPFVSPLDRFEMTHVQASRRLQSEEDVRSRSHSRSRASTVSNEGFPASPFEDPAVPQTARYAPIPAISDDNVDRPQTSGRSLAGDSTLFSQTAIGAYKTKDPVAQALVDRRAGEIHEWKIHWQTPAIMVATWVAGVAAALGHHFFYQSLDGQPAEDQLTMVRYGTALGYFVKACLVGSVILSYRQRIWHTFRQKAMTLSAIDGLFSVTEDPTQFINLEMLRNGKLATVMALGSWLIPIASVLSPASLTSESRTFVTNDTCSVATLNFTHESYYNFRGGGEFTGAALVYYNTTDIDAKTDGWFDYFDQPSQYLKRLAVTSVYLGQPSTFVNASTNSCGAGYNCTYSIDIQGPGYKCSEVANSSHPDPQDPNVPFNISSMAPKGDLVYQASVDLNDYRDPQTNTQSNGVPEPGYDPDTLGVFDSEPVLWIGYAINTSTPYTSSDPQAYQDKWKNVQEPKIFKCVAHYTNYTFEMHYNDTTQTANRTARTFLDPIIDTSVSLNPANESEYLATPPANYVHPTDVARYKLTASYHAMGQQLRNFLRGTIAYTPPYFVSKSDISETRLLQTSSSYAVENLMEEVQSMYEDMLVTLMAEPYLVIASHTNVSCTRRKNVNTFIYHREGLWIGYALAVAVAFLFLLIGGWSIWENGVSSDTQFSRIMVTTRNPTIDRLSVGACLGGDPFPKELTRTKLRFGVLQEEEWKEGPLGKVEHCCFGTEGETHGIVKHGTYAGLRKYLRDEEEVGDVDEKEGLLKAGERDECTCRRR